jgi:hypothetical protein
MTKSEQLSLDTYASPGEARAARRLVNNILAAGCAVSVNDGEEWTVTRSTDRDTILAALCTTEMDILGIYRDGASVGRISLIYGNDHDGSELVADHTASPEIEAMLG